MPSWFQENSYATLALGIIAGATIASIITNLRETYARRRTRTEKQWSALHPSADTPAFFKYHGAKSLIEKMEQDFRITTEKLHAIVKHFIQEMNKGLQTEGQTLKMLPSYVVKRPNGKELGTFLALDLGGTNFRVCEVSLEGQGRYRMMQKKFQISDEIKTGTAEMMFGFIAEGIQAFIKEHDTDLSKRVPMGFTFSFPIKQDCLKTGTLVHWNKGFEVKGNWEENDISGLLQRELDRRGMNIEINAIINDTVGTLVAHSYGDPGTRVGVILGTGTNAAYVEQASRIPKYKGDIPPSGEMVINIEWGAFDNEKVVLPITKYDVMLDRETPNPGWQTFEKLISGMYLGEIVRLALMDLVDHGEVFRGLSMNALSTPNSFETSFMSRIERDHSADLIDTSIVLEGLLGLKRTTLEDRTIVKRVCELVGMRAARLSAAAIGGVISKINALDGCTVGIDGSVFEHYPHFKNRMLDALLELFGFSAQNIMLQLARDGSGVGAALVAMTANATTT